MLCASYLTSYAFRKLPDILCSSLTEAREARGDYYEEYY